MSSQTAKLDSRNLESGFESEVADYGEILIRSFSPDGDDERQMGELVFDNAFLGKPLQDICSCKQWFKEVVLTPYIKHQPENIHVAVHKESGRLIGYITGSTGGRQFEQQQYSMVRQQVISLAVSLTMPWSFLDHSHRQFATHVIFKGESERPGHPDSGVHWHYQVDKDFRGQGIGTKLLRRFIDDAVEAGFDRIWAEVMAYDEKPPQYFEEQGWSIYDSRPTSIFGRHVDYPVEVLCIEQPLSSLDAKVKSA